MALCPTFTKYKGPRDAAGQAAELIGSVVAELHYLPPYPPDLNPIELTFSKIK